MKTSRASHVAVSALTISFFTFALASCGSVSTSIDGRAVIGKSILFSSLRSNDKAATINLDGQQVEVTTTQISWGEHEALPLPANWNRVELSKSLSCIAIDVDGHDFGSIPAAQ